jgi:hypothetical protein
MMPDAEFDSFLTIGMTGPATIPGAISTIGIDFASWTESSGISADNGAVRATPHLHTPGLPTILLAGSELSALGAFWRRFSSWTLSTAVRRTR